MSSGSSFETERNLSQTDALVMLRLGDLERTGISSRCVRLLGSAWRSSRRPAAPRNGRRGPDKQSACLLASDSRARLPRQPSRERNGTGNGGRGNYARDPARLAVARFRFPRLGLAVSGGWQPASSCLDPLGLPARRTAHMEKMGTRRRGSDAENKQQKYRGLSVLCR